MKELNDKISELITEFGKPEWKNNDVKEMKEYCIRKLSLLGIELSGMKKVLVLKTLQRIKVQSTVEELLKYLAEALFYT